MAAATAMTNRHIVSTILHHLSDMKYKDRRQYGPDEPVEFLEFRPTLVPSILVNKLWADEGTSILWKRYPHLPALKGMDADRRQYYADKAQRIFSLSPPPGHSETLDYLDGLMWPNLKSLELEIDFQRYGMKFASMLHAEVEHVELSGLQSGESTYFVETVLPALFPGKKLQSIRIGLDTIHDDDLIHVSTLFGHLDACPSISNIEFKSTNFVDKDALFVRLSQRPGLRGLEIDLDPGLAMLPLISGPNSLPSPFASLKRLSVMCYPEVALALPMHLQAIEELQLDIARIPNQPVQETDYMVFENIIEPVTHCPQLKLLKVNVGLLAEDFPSFSSFPTLKGASLIALAKACPMLDDITLQATEPAAVDGSRISSQDFDDFCKALPRLRSLILKLHPITASALQYTALQSLGEHCAELEFLRLKIPSQLPSLPVPSAVPQILISDEATSGSVAPKKKQTFTDEKFHQTESVDNPLPDSRPIDVAPNPSPTTPPHTAPLFPKLMHLALSRPETALAVAADSFTVSSSSHSTSDIVDPDLEEDLVRSWAHSLLTHFPRLEILEAWGDWAGQDNESLNYFLPTEELLASTWEFLSGVEQDLWEDDEEESDHRASWHTFGSGEDWDKASLMNEYAVTDHDAQPDLEKLYFYEDEPDGMITPGRTIEESEFFKTA